LTLIFADIDGQSLADKPRPVDRRHDSRRIEEVAKMTTRSGSKNNAPPAGKKTARTLPAKTMKADQAKRIKGGKTIGNSKYDG
jgi:hypothetical protein